MKIWLHYVFKNNINSFNNLCFQSNTFAEVNKILNVSQSNTSDSSIEVFQLIWTDCKYNIYNWINFRGSASTYVFI